MNSRDIISLCWGNLMRRKTRTVLAVIGVIVGICAIVVMVSIGFGLSESFEAMLGSWGNLHTIQVNNYNSGRSSNGQTYTLDDNMVATFEKINGVTGASPVVSLYQTIGIGHMVTSAQIYGIKPEMMEVMDLNIQEGRLLNSSDKYQMVFGRDVASWFYNPRQQQGNNWNNSEATVDVISKDVILTNDWNYGTNNEGDGEGDGMHFEYIECEGVGLLSNESDESAYRVYMSLDGVLELQEIFAKANGEKVTTKNGKKTYEQVLIYVDDTEKVADISKYIKETYGFYTYSLNDELENLNNMARIIELVLGGIGAVSLLVAAIGIANTMIMSVYERTREIGVMKVIGASLKDIGRMFLIEAGMIGFIGGVIGLVLSFGLSLLMNTLLLPVMGGLLGYSGEGMVASVIPWWLALAALAFTTFVGIASGYYPARRAMKLSALEGLRND